MISLHGRQRGLSRRSGHGRWADFLGVVDGEEEEVGEGVKAMVAEGVELAEEV